MLHQTLTIITANIGIGCLAYSYYLLRSFKDRVDKSSSDEMSRILLEKDVTDFTKKIRKKEVTFQMVKDFYERFVKMNEPAMRLKRAWVFFVFSGVFFIMTSVLGNLNFLSLFDTLAYNFLSFALVFLAVAFRDLIYLGKKIV